MGDPGPPGKSQGLLTDNNIKSSIHEHKMFFHLVIPLKKSILTVFCSFQSIRTSARMVECMLMVVRSLAALNAHELHGGKEANKQKSGFSSDRTKGNTVRSNSLGFDWCHGNPH